MGEIGPAVETLNDGIMDTIVFKENTSSVTASTLDIFLPIAGMASCLPRLIQEKEKEQMAG